MDSENSENLIAFSAFFLPVTITTTYTFIYYLIPNFLLPKRYLNFGIYTIYTLIISSVYIIISAFYGLVLALGLHWTDNFPISKSLFYIMISIYLVVAIASAFSLLKYNYSSAAKNEELKNRILEAQLKLKDQELQYLKMQIHPHFLFNTLNTIYGLSLSNHIQTSEMILQLSDLLDYILYQTKKPLVKLEDEINHIKNYIDLEKKRFRDTLKIDFECDPIPPDMEIPPMLLLPFVENSFKHGRDSQGELQIHIKLKIQNGHLEFEISNSKSSKMGEGSDGIGLQNIKRRLDILYPENHALKIENSENSFKVYLKLSILKEPVNVT